MYQVHPDDKEQKTYLQKLKEDFEKEEDLIKLLANAGSNQLIQTLFAVPEGDKGKPKEEQKTYLEN